MKTNLASLFLYGMTVVGVGGVLANGAVAVLSESPVEEVEVPILALPEEMPTNSIEILKTSEGSTPVKEEKSWGEPAEITENSWEKPVENPDKSRQNPDKIPTEPAPHAKNRQEYISMYNGICPSQQPKDDGFWADNHYQAAVGAYTEGYVLESLLQQEWEYNKSGRWGVEGTVPVDTFWNLHITEGNRAGYHTELYINWDTYEAWWYNRYYDYDRTNFYEKYGEPYPPEWDEAVTEATRYLHYLEDTYNAHCPND